MRNLLRGSWVHIARVLIAMASVALPSASAIAQPEQRQTQRPGSPDSLLTAALSRAAEGDTNQALALLERAQKASPKNTDVLFWRAVVMSRSTFLRFGDVPRNLIAWKLLERAEELDRTNARYAIEMGRIRLMTPMLRIEAERQFRRALHVAETSNDPNNIAEAAYQIGLIKQRRYLTTADRYMVTSPGMLFDPIAAGSRLHYVQEFLEQHSHPITGIGSVDRFEAEELFRRALSALPTHEPSAISLLSIIYDQRRYSEMLQVAKPFLETATGSARIRLAAGLASYRLGMLKDADRLFKEAVERMPADDRADMVSLGRIIRKPDAVSYDALSDTARMQTDSAYWESADPLLSTPENEAWLEFMARNAYSDLRWTDGDMRQVGWKTDRGMIVARYGEPPQIATFAPEGNYDSGDAIGRILTVWRWPDQDMHFVFTGPPAMNVSTFAGNFRSFAEEMRDEVPFSLKNLAIAANVDTIPMQIARFRGKTANDVTLVVAATANPAKLYGKSEVDQGTLAWTLRMGEPSRMKLFSTDTLRVRMPAPSAASQVWIQDVKPGNYRVRVEALDPSIVSASGRAQDQVEARLVVPGALMLSDALVGYKANVPNGTLSGLDDAALLPRGDLTMKEGEQFSLYWEMYGLVPEADGRVKYDVKIVVRLLEMDRGKNQVRLLLGNISDAVGVSPVGDQTLGYSFSGEELLGSRNRVPRLFNMGLGSSPAGKYRIELTVTDKVTKSSMRTDRIFYLGKK